jgi:hypothetical protein
MNANFARYANGRWRVYSSFPFPLPVRAKIYHARTAVLSFSSLQTLRPGAFVNPAREHLAATRRTVK